MRITVYLGVGFVLGCRDYEKVIPDPEEDDSGLLEVTEEAQTETSTEESETEENGSNTPNSVEEENETNSHENQNEPSGNSDEPINPDYLIYTFANGYQNNQITEVNTATRLVTGELSAIMYDSSTGGYCSIDWVFDSSSVVDDTDMNDGSVNSFDGSMETWFGFIITSSPQTSGSCSNMNSMSQEILDMIMMDQPGFGYGPLTDNLLYYLNSDHTPNWNEIEGYVFTGILSSYLFSENGERAYLDINQAYAYPITDGTTTWDSTVNEYPQGDELMTSVLPTDAFYVSSYYFGIALH